MSEVPDAIGHLDEMARRWAEQLEARGIEVRGVGEVDGLLLKASALTAERDAALARAEKAEGELGRLREIVQTTYHDERAELARLKASLPKTADGVAIVPGMKVFVRRWPDERTEVEPDRIVFSLESYDAYDPVQRAYSTREAALAAKDG